MNSACLAPPVEEVLVRNDFVGGAIHVTCRRVEPVVHPVSGYRIVLSYAGPIDQTNWNPALQLFKWDHYPLSVRVPSFSSGGLNRHCLCNGPGYLMCVTAAGVLEGDWENAIHVDEQRAVRTIRYLPQGYDMAGF